LGDEGKQVKKHRGGSGPPPYPAVPATKGAGESDGEDTYGPDAPFTNSDPAMLYPLGSLLIMEHLAGALE